MLFDDFENFLDIIFVLLCFRVCAAKTDVLIWSDFNVTFNVHGAHACCKFFLCALGWGMHA